LRLRQLDDRASARQRRRLRAVRCVIGDRQRACPNAFRAAMTAAAARKTST